MRAEIRNEVELIQPIDDAEAQAKSYFALVDGEHVLLVDHINAELWLPSGGHVEPGEHPRTTALREAREELSLEAEFLVDGPLFLTIAETVGKTAGHTDVSLWYVLNGNRHDRIQFDETEFYGVRWFHRDDVPLGRADPNLERFLAKLYD